jgi:ABC-type sugar transport system substrate-binding protein
MSDTYRIGFANLTEIVDYPVQVRESLERAVAEAGHIKLIVRDNDLNDERATANAIEFATMGLDLIIMYHINERLGSSLRTILLPKPIICVDIPMPLTTYVGIDNTHMGSMAGEALIEWIDAHWDGRAERFLGLIDSRVVGPVRERVTQPFQLLQSQAKGEPPGVMYLDMRYAEDENYRLVHDALLEWANFNRIAIVAYNDQTALTALRAIEATGAQDRVVMVGHAASAVVIEQIEAGTPIVASTLSYPDKYGPLIIELAVRMINHERVPLKNHVELGMLKAW